MESDQAVIISYLIENDLPFIPRVGDYTYEAWASFLKCSTKTIERWVKKYRIPIRKPGNEIWLRAKDVHKYIPYLGEEDDHE